jgi:hypothetical protein
MKREEEEQVVRRREGCFIVVAVLLFIWSCSPVFAAWSYTEVREPPGVELSHSEILDDIYGGTFTGSGTDLGYGHWTEFSNGTVTALRVFDTDDLTEIIHIVTGDEGNVDQVWTDGLTSVTAQAKYAAHDQSFGWNGGGSGTDYYQLLTHDDVSLGTVVPISISGDFLWGTKPNGDEYWSKDSYNDDELDHMVTYKVEGLETDWTVWLLFWEDLTGSYPSSDRDFNDFVIEVRAIPEPASMLLFGLGGLALLRKRKA